MLQRFLAFLLNDVWRSDESSEHQTSTESDRCVDGCFTLCHIVLSSSLYQQVCAPCSLDWTVTETSLHFFWMPLILLCCVKKKKKKKGRLGLQGLFRFSLCIFAHNRQHQQLCANQVRRQKARETRGERDKETWQGGRQYRWDRQRKTHTHAIIKKDRVYSPISPPRQVIIISQVAPLNHLN